MASAVSGDLRAEMDAEAAVTPEKIIQAVEQIVALAHPVAVLAFGSRARGDHRHESDLDLAVIVDNYDPKVDRRPVWRADIDVWMNMDVLVYDVHRDRALSSSAASVQHEVRKDGVLLYERTTGLFDRAAAARLV